MSKFKLYYPVVTVDKKELLPAGTILTKKIIDAVARSDRKAPHKKYSLLKIGSIKKDILGFHEYPRYRQKSNEIIDLMSNIRLIKPVADSLEYFKSNDHYTYIHILKVFCLSVVLAKDLISDHREYFKIIAAAPVHDFGKVSVPLEILKRSTPLSRSEWGIVEHHTTAGYVLLSYYLKDSSHLTCEIARDHHERINGMGYPRGKRLRNKMVEIVAASDIFDALVSPRPYRPISFDKRTALEELTLMAQRKELSWDIVKALIAFNRSNTPHYSTVNVSLKQRGTPPPGNLHGITI